MRSSFHVYLNELMLRLYIQHQISLIILEKYIFRSHNSLQLNRFARNKLASRIMK